MTTAHARQLRGLARSSTLNLVGGGATAVLTLGLTLVFTRGLGTEAAGALFSAIALFQVITAVAGLGVETGLVRFVTARHSSDWIGVDDRSLWSIALTPVAVAGAILGAALFLMAGPVGQSIGGSLGEETAASLRVMAVFLPMAALSLSILGATRGYSTMKPTVMVDRVGRPLFQLAVVGIGVLLSWPMEAIAAGWASTYVVQLLASWVWLKRLQDMDSHPGSEVRSRRAALVEFWRFTLPRAAATTMRTTLQWSDVVLVAALASPEQAAVYTVCTRLLQLGLLAAFSVGQAAEPLFGEAVARRDRPRTQHLYQVATAWLMLVTWPWYLLLAVFAAPALRIFGAGYETGAGAVVILVGSVVFAASVGPADILLVMTGKTMWSLWNAAASLAVNVGLNLLLIPSLGFTGAAIAWTAGRVASNALPAVQLWRDGGFHPFSRAWVLAAGCSLAIFGVLSLTARAVFGSSLSTAIIGALVMTGLFVGLLHRFRRPLAIDLAIASLRRSS